MRCQPLQVAPSSTSASRRSSSGSRSPNDSATGSTRSQCARVSAYRDLAVSSSPAVYAAANSSVPAMSEPTWSFTYAT